MRLHSLALVSSTLRSGVSRAVLTGVLATALPSLSQAQSLTGLGFLPGGSYSQAAGISADGTIVVGYGDSTLAAGAEAFRWSGGVMAGLGLLPGGTLSRSYATNSDGTIVVGVSTSAAHPVGEAFIWSGGVMTGLGVLAGGNYSVANAVNADGSVVVGQGDSTAFGSGEAFRWTGGVMTGLGVLAGGVTSHAYGVSADGSVVVGDGDSTAVPNIEGFRWTQGTGMVGLGILAGGTYSHATAISADGLVIVGNGDSTATPGTGEAIRWTAGTGWVSLGILPGGLYSGANAVSANGSVVVGQSASTAAPAGEAFRWTASTGIQSIKDLLVASGVNMTGWTLNSAVGVSADGTLIVGTGIDPASITEAWLARCITTCAITTPGTVAQSFSGQSAMGQTGNAAIGNSLGSFYEYAMQAYKPSTVPGSPYSVFAYGGYDSDPAAAGTLGLTMKLSNSMIAGVAVSANYVKTNMVYDGSAKMSGGSLGAFFARMPDAGMQWLVGIDGIALKGDVSRGYLNGNSLTSSSGSTTANGYGFIGRVGYTFDNVVPKTQVTPFASYAYSSIHFNGYTETSGPFPAQFNGFADNTQTSRLGADARYTLAPGRWLWGTLAWAHRLDRAKGADISGTLIGLFGMTAPGIVVAPDWAEVTGGIRLPAWKNGAVTASLTASVPAHYATTYTARVGITQAF